MMKFLYDLIITPIEILVECTFSIMHLALKDYGLAIIAVSLVIQTLVLPLYLRSDAIQEEERQRQKNMAHWVDHIRKNFKGEERFMVLSTYYRQQGYKPWYALRSSFSILLQIPFFVAAYRYLSGITTIQGQKFLFISDLGQPDATFQIGEFVINILPITMTAINIVSGIIYTKGLKLRDKLQVYGLAIVFLVLLYKSPSGLVLYWTVNNLYSLCKNFVLRIIAEKNQAKESRQITRDNSFADKKSFDRIFTCSTIFLTLLLGGIITLNVVGASPTEFITGKNTPISIVITNISIYVGIFLIWFRIFYELMIPKVKRLFTYFVVFISINAFLNYMFWGNKFGKMSSLLVYEEGRIYSIWDKVINLLIAVLVMIAVVALIRKLPRFVAYTMGIVTLTAFIFCSYNCYKINIQNKKYYDSRSEDITDDKILNISKNGKNVVIIMLDRAIDAYVPYIFNEKPELLKSFDGFTWYSNTLSFGKCTNYGAPALYGGYEYTPSAMNERDKELLKDKHDEALLVLPRLFSDKGFDAIVCDPPYAGYAWDPDLSIYDDYEGIKTYKLEGAYTKKYYSDYLFAYQLDQRNAFVNYSMMRTVPVAIQHIFYNRGNYLYQSRGGIKQTFIDNYSALLNFPNITNVVDVGNVFLQIQNSITHEVALLKEPEYIPYEGISINGFDKKTEYDGPDIVLNGEAMHMNNLYQAAHYQDNMAAFILLAKWFDYLKDNDCWDNTRIVLVSDHGNALNQFDKMILEDGLDAQYYNPLLMVKDFYSKGFKESKEFMTNADVPTLATKSIIDNPANPFTGRRLSGVFKEDTQLITTSDNWDTSINNGFKFDTSDGEWYAVKPGDIFDSNNWKLIEE